MKDSKEYYENFKNNPAEFFKANAEHFRKVFDTHINAINKQKEDLIRKRLIEKGYEKHIDNFLTIQRFPKLSIAIHDDWEYYFVDNGTIDGDFIIAIKEKFDY